MDTIRNYFLPQGITKAAYALVAALIFFILDIETLSFLSLLLVLFFLFAYRNPSRLWADISDYGVYSPADGKVVAIEDINDDEYGYKLTIDSSCMQSGVLRSPFDAKKVSFKLQRGARLAQKSPLFASLNERLEALFENEKKRVKVMHILKRTPLPIELIAKKNQSKCCDIYGFAYNAVSVVYLPKEFRLNVHVGQRVYASQNIIGYFSN